MADTVSVDVARDPDPLPLLHMVLGGVAMRHHLSFDALDDLHLAIDNLVAEDKPPQGTLSMAVTVSADSVEIRLEPLHNPDLRATLAGGAVPAEAEGRCIDVCLMLRSLVDGYVVGDISEDAYAVEILKHTGR